MDLGRRATRVLIQLVRALQVRAGRLADRLDASSRGVDESVAEPGIEDEAQRAPGTGQGSGGPPAHWVNLVRRHAPQLLRPAASAQPPPAAAASSTRVGHLPATARALSQPQGAAADVRQVSQGALPERRSESPRPQPGSTHNAGADLRRTAPPVAAGYRSPRCEPVKHNEPHRGVAPSVAVPGFGVRRPLSTRQASLPRTTQTAPAKLQPNRSEPGQRTPRGRPRPQAEAAAVATGPTVLRDPSEGREPLQRPPVSPWPESALPTGGGSVSNNGAPAAPPEGVSRGTGHVMSTESQASTGRAGDAGIAEVPQPPAASAPLASAGPLSPAVEPSARPQAQACDAEPPAAHKAPAVQRASPFVIRPACSEPRWPRLADEPDLAAEPGGVKPGPWPSLPDEGAAQEGLARSDMLRATQQQERVMQRKRTLDIEQRGGLWNV